MKKISLLLLLSVFLFSCKNEKKEETELKSNEVAVIENKTTNNEKITEETTINVEEQVENKTEDIINKETITTEEKKPIIKVKEISKNTINNTVNKGKETTQNTINEVVEEANTVVEEVIEKPKEVVEETTNEVTETVTKVEEKAETVVAEVVKEKPKPVIQELTLAQKVAKGKKLFNTGICTTCHDPKKKKIGPTLKEISKTYRKKHASIAKFLKGNASAIVWPKKFMMMKPNIDDVTSKMSKGDLEALDAYIMSIK